MAFSSLPAAEEARDTIDMQDSLLASLCLEAFYGSLHLLVSTYLLYPSDPSYSKNVDGDVPPQPVEFNSGIFCCQIHLIINKEAREIYCICKTQEGQKLV